MELLMRPLIRLIPLTLLLVLTGCAGKKHLSREMGGFETVPAVTAFRQPIKTVASDVFSGHFKPIYDKKTQGSVDNLMLTGNRYVAFKTTRRRFIVLDQETGKRLCKIQRRRGYIFGPVIDDTLLVMVDKSPWGRIEVINLFTGKAIARQVEFGIKTEPFTIDGNLIFGTTRGLKSLSFPGLEPRWTDTCESPVNILPAHDQTTIYAVSGARQARAVDAETGAGRWSVELPSDIVSEIGLGRYLYLGLDDGRLVALSRTDGSMVWEHTIGYLVRGGLVEEGDGLFFGCTDGQVYGLNAADGTPRWTFQTGGVVVATPTVFGSAVVVGSLDRYLYSIHGVSGKLIDKVRLNGPITAPVAAGGLRIFAATRNNRIYCFEGR